MGRILLIVLLALVGYLLFKGSRARIGRGRPGQRPAERMVVCGHCGVHLPESDSIRDGRRHFCSEEHRRLAG